VPRHPQSPGDISVNEAKVPTAAEFTFQAKNQFFPNLWSLRENILSLQLHVPFIPSKALQLFFAPSGRQIHWLQYFLPTYYPPMGLPVKSER